MLDKWALLQVFTPDMNLQLEISIIDTPDSVSPETDFAIKPSAVQPVTFNPSQLPTKNEPWPSSINLPLSQTYHIQLRLQERKPSIKKNTL